MDTKNLKRRLPEIIISLTVAASFFFSLVYILAKVILSEALNYTAEYKIMIFQCAFGLAIINLPTLLRKLGIQVPTLLAIMFTVFLWCAIFAGEVLNLYYRVPIWDDILHFYSGILATVFGFSLPNTLNKNAIDDKSQPSALVISIFAATFSITLGVMWEIYEFSFDAILGLNMQKFAIKSHGNSHTLVNLIGREALVDTMTDLITDTSAAVITALIGYFYLERHK